MAPLFEAMNRVMSLAVHVLVQEDDAYALGIIADCLRCCDGMLRRSLFRLRRR